MSIVEQLQDVINESLACTNDRIDKIHSDERAKCIFSYITGALSYVNGVKILMKEKQYDSVLPLSRAFLELYAPICHMIEKYNAADEFDDYFRYLVAEDMKQDKNVYNSMKCDVTILDEDERQNVLASYIQRWENFINMYFLNKAREIDQNNKESSIIKIINNLYKTYYDKFKDISNSKAQFIGNALKNNNAFINEFGYKYDGSYVIYKLLCNEAHGNIGMVDSRTVHNGYFSINLSNEEQALSAAQCIVWCLKDITYRFDAMFK